MFLLLFFVRLSPKVSSLALVVFCLFLFIFLLLFLLLHPFTVYVSLFYFVASFAVPIRLTVYFSKELLICTMTQL